MQPAPRDERIVVDPRPGNDYMIPNPNPRGKKVKMPVAKKKPVKGGEKAYPMPRIQPLKPRNGGGIIGVEGRNVNPFYNTY